MGGIRNSVTILGAVSITVLIVAAFAFSSDNGIGSNDIFNIISSVDAHGDYQTIVPGSVVIDPRNAQTTSLSLTTVVAVPPNERNLFVGFGWVYEDGLSAYVVTTHNGVRDSQQRPDGWHPHNVVIEPFAGASVTHCITDITDNTHSGVIINQGGISTEARNSELSTFMDPPTAISFDIIPEPTCPLGVGIGLHQMEPAPVEEEESGGGKGGGQGGGNPNK